MLSYFLSAVVIILGLYKLYKYCTYKPPGFPPGPPRIPIFGSYLLLLLINFKYLHKAVTVLCNYYKTKIIGFYFGDVKIVVVSDYNGVRESLFRPEFDGRPGLYAVKLREPEFRLLGVFFIEGNYWKDQRWFTLRYLRDFGFGRRDLVYEEEITDEMQKLMALLKDGPKFEHEKQLMKNGSWLFPDVLISAMGNCYIQALCGERIPRNEQYKTLKAGRGAKGFNLTVNEYGCMLSILPWLRHVFPYWSKYKILREYSMDLYDFAHEVVKKHVDTYEEGRIRSFVDMYIKEIKEGEKSGIDYGYLYDQLYFISKDLMFPSMSALAITISTLFQNLLHHPHIIKKIQEEIDEVVGSGRLPHLDDRINLPYCEATLREVMRYETLVHMNVPHKVLDKEQEFMGYTIPENTVMYANFQQFHMDKETWGDPENFRPERFLGDDGKLCLKKDLSLPFGAGKRLCAGETFARNTMFLCYTAILQNFNIKTPDGKLPDLSKRRCGLVTGPEDFYLTLESR